MSQSIRALPPAWAAIAYALLGIGLFFVAGFLIRYMTRLPWAESPEGRHLVAVSANVGAFFALYLALTIWPEFPGRTAVRMALFVAIVINCGWRWWLLEKHLRERKHGM